MSHELTPLRIVTFRDVLLVLVIVLLLVLAGFDYEHDYESRARFLGLRIQSREPPTGQNQPIYG